MDEMRMDVDCLELQRAELEAAKSVYEDGMYYFYKDGRIKGQIDIEFPPYPQKSAIYMMINNEPKYVTVSVLPPARIHFELPPDYPKHSVLEITLVECIWMSPQMIEEFLVRFEAICERDFGQGQIFQCVIVMGSMVLDRLNELTDICIDFTPWVQSKNLSAEEVLKLVSEHSEKSEIKDFDKKCFDCEICFESKSGRDCARIRPCLHVFCTECITHYISEKTRQAHIHEIMCPSLECHNPIPQQTIKLIIGEQEFERYDRILLEQELSNMEDIVICPKLNCQRSIPVKPCEGNLGYCEWCEHAFCIKCWKTYHGIEKCAVVDFKKFLLFPKRPTDSESAEDIQEDEEALTDREALVKAWEERDETGRKELAKHFGGMEKLREMVETSQSESWIEENSKLCPSCFAPIQKTEGCNKMACEKCHKFFCWLCGTILNKKDPYAHFRDDGPCAQRLFEVPLDDEDSDEEDEEEEEEEEDED